MNALLVRTAFLLACAGAIGCVSPLVRAARDQSDPVFRSTLERHPQPIAPKELVEIARARARLALRVTEGLEAKRAVDAAARCAESLRSELEERALRSDDTGAGAAMVLADQHLVPPLAYAARFASADPGWRAVGARSLVLVDSNPSGPPCDPDWHAPCDRMSPRPVGHVGRWRRAAFLDVALEVRRAGIAAARDAGDPADVPMLLDAARREPEVELRSLAISAVARGAWLDGVIGLADLWPSATESERVALVRAWAEVTRSDTGAGRVDTAPFRVGALGAEPSASMGMRAWDVAFEQLWRTAEIDAGWPSFLAAAELLRARRDGDPGLVALSAEGSALATLVRGIESAPTDVRVKVIEAVPLDHPRLLKAVVDAANSEVAAVSVAAHARLLDSNGREGQSASRKSSLDALAKYAADDGDAADAALLALVRSSDPRAKPLLEKQAKSDEATRRAKAAEALASLADGSSAARLLVDEDVSVRLTAACALLGSSFR